MSWRDALSSRGGFVRVLLSAGILSVLAQGIALARQILLVASFGFSRDLDLYSTIYAIFSIAVFSVAAIVENVFVALLSDVREKHGEESMRGALRPFMAAAFVFACVWIVFLVAIFPVLSIPFTAGFEASAGPALYSLGLHGIPWAFFVLVYGALGASLKTAHCFGRFFLVEILVSATSTAMIYLRHDRIEHVMDAFGVAYGIAVLVLAVMVVRASTQARGVRFPWREFLGRISRFFASNQLGTLGTLAERYWFSHLPAGGIASLALVQQLTMSLAGLLSFRDAYLVPLAGTAGREARLARLLMGLFLLSTATSVFVVASAEPICRLLFLYGKAAAKDVEAVSMLLSISVVAMTLSIVATPVWRLQQMQGIFRPISILYLVSAASTLIMGWVAIAKLALGVPGMALVATLNAAVAFVVGMRMARTRGATPEATGTLRFALGSLVLFLAAGGLAAGVGAQFPANAFVQLVSIAACYGSTILAYIIVARRPLSSIILAN